MKEDFGRNVMVGLFMLVGLAALCALIILFGEQPEAFVGGTYPVTIYFKDLPQDVGGSQVLMNGQVIGRVEDIAFREPNNPAAGMEVRTDIFRKYVVPEGSHAFLVLPAVGFGSSRFEIRPGPSGRLLPTDGSVPLTGEVVGGLDTLLPKTTLATLERVATQVGDFAEALTPAAEDMHDLLQPRRPADVDRPDALEMGNVSTAVQRLDGVLRSIQEVLGDPETENKLAEAIDNLHAASADARVATEHFRELGQGLQTLPNDVRQMTDRVNGFVDDTDERVNRLAQVMIADAESLGRFLQRMETIADGVTEGQGTVGKLLSDEKLYEAMLLSAQRLDDTLKELQVLIRKLEREGVVKPLL
jgi:ABC-type transporter Mla subunit MlaD